MAEIPVGRSYEGAGVGWVGSIVRVKDGYLSKVRKGRGCYEFIFTCDSFEDAATIVETLLEAWCIQVSSSTEET